MRDFFQKKLRYFFKTLIFGSKNRKFHFLLLI